MIVENKNMLKRSSIIQSKLEYPASKSVTGALEPGTFPLRWELCASSYLHDLFCFSIRLCYQFIDFKIIPKVTI